jgi:hypothetical protein
MPQTHFPHRATADHAARASESAALVLGASHPLVHTLEALATVASQCVAVAALFTAALIASTSGAAWGVPVAASAALVLLILALAAALLLQRRRDEAVALIAAGEGDVPIRAVERERRRLLSRRMRFGLAASLDALVKEAANPPAVPVRPLVDPVAVRQLGPELRELAGLLRAEPADARAVALVWRLICDGVASPLHRGNVGELREQLARIRFLLATGRG